MSAIADVESGVVKADIEIAAPPEKVFRALTDPRELAAWWGSPETYRASSWEVDLRPGGKWRSQGAGVKDGKPFSVGGEYLEIDPPRLLVFTWEPSWEEFARTTVRYDLAAVAGGTRLVVTHSGFAGRASAIGHYEGWTKVLGWLAAHVAGGAR